MKIHLLSALVTSSLLALACAGNQNEAQEPDTSKETEEAVDAVGTEVEQGAESAADSVEEGVNEGAEAVDEATEDEPAPD